MLANYAEVLTLPGAWRFSLAGAILRMPMSMVGISMILTVKAAYGNYTLAGLVVAVSIVGTSVCAPILARMVDRYGQRKVMLPSLVICAVSLAVFSVASLWVAPVWVVFVASALSGATWGAPGALVRSRWSTVVQEPRQLTAAYALEAAVDEFVFVVGPIVATMVGTALHPATGLILSILFITIGSVGFFSQVDTEPPIVHVDRTQRAGTVITHPVVIGLALTYVGAGAMFGATDVSVVAFTEENMQPALAGVLLGIFAFGSLVAALIYGARTWRQPLWKLFGMGVVALALGTSSFLLATNMWVLGLAMLVTGLTIAPTMTNVNMIIAKVVPSGQLTEGLTWMSTAMNIGVSLGSMLSGRWVDANGAAGGFWVVMAFAWIMVVLMIVGLPSLRRHTVSAERASHLPAIENDGEHSGEDH
ncbi:MFS transporter [Schaalia canis]|uniref:MFS transporter n=1 Tax=Schaalia canis TaxID=100469 RepID=A0A3P1SEM4_9ACTO|nr:MFS transporter [Schaalia canis]RRC94762.1 MFS transporter [Schaalia canis]